MAPEVLRCPLKRKPSDFKDRTDLMYGCAADIWSLGIVVYKLLTGMTPVLRDETGHVCYPMFPKGLSQGAVNFVCACLNTDPMLRPTCQQLLKCEWITPRRRCNLAMPDGEILTI